MAGQQILCNRPVPERKLKWETLINYSSHKVLGTWLDTYLTVQGAGRHFLSKVCNGWEGVQATVTVRKLRLQQSLQSHFQNIIKALSAQHQSSDKFLELNFVAELSIKQSLKKLSSASLTTQEAKVNFLLEFQPQLNVLSFFLFHQKIHAYI